MHALPGFGCPRLANVPMLCRTDHTCLSAEINRAQGFTCFQPVHGVLRPQLGVCRVPEELEQISSQDWHRGSDTADRACACSSPYTMAFTPKCTVGIFVCASTSTAHYMRLTILRLACRRELFYGRVNHPDRAARGLRGVPLQRRCPAEQQQDPDREPGIRPFWLASSQPHLAWRAGPAVCRCAGPTGPEGDTVKGAAPTGPEGDTVKGLSTTALFCLEMHVCRYRHAMQCMQGAG